MKNLIFTIAVAGCVSGCAGVNPNAVRVECENGTAFYGTKKPRVEQSITSSGILINAKENTSNTYYYHPSVPLVIEECKYTDGKAAGKIAWQRVFVIDPVKSDGKNTFTSIVDANKRAYEAICKSPVPPKELLLSKAGYAGSSFEWFAYAPAGDRASQNDTRFSNGDRDYEIETEFQAILEKHIPGYQGLKIATEHNRYNGRIEDPLNAIQTFLDHPEKQTELDADFAKYFGNTAGKRASAFDIAKRQAIIDKRRAEYQWKYEAWTEKNNQIKRQFGQYTNKTVNGDALHEEYKAIEADQKALDEERKATK